MVVAMVAVGVGGEGEVEGGVAGCNKSSSLYGNIAREVGNAGKPISVSRNVYLQPLSTSMADQSLWLQEEEPLIEDSEEEHTQKPSMW
jgi:hypothetical protein